MASAHLVTWVRGEYVTPAIKPIKFIPDGRCFLDSSYQEPLNLNEAIPGTLQTGSAQKRGRSCVDGVPERGTGGLLPEDTVHMLHHGPPM